ncbi:MAG TPA: hypothetical protein VHC47_08175, partial [Mucilaginibacter sp.]|nr:hypothetical protein [Mucilaginibacter sp.]
FLLSSLREIFAYPERIVGPGSLLRKISSKNDNKALHLNISVEFAAANILRMSQYKVHLLEDLGIEGLVAGADTHELIRE